MYDAQKYDRSTHDPPILHHGLRGSGDRHGPIPYCPNCLHRGELDAMGGLVGLLRDRTYVGHLTCMASGFG